MNTKLRILLAASLAFNAVFAVRYLLVAVGPEERPTMEDRARSMAAKLDLDDEQKSLFEQFLAEYMELRQRREPQRQAFCDELLKADPDPRVLKNYSVGRDAVKHRLAWLDLMRRFVKTLRPEQREMFVEMIRNHRSPRSEPSQTPKASSE